jgi:inorganic pyrophosphatase/exopolyphosphatase
MTKYLITSGRDFADIDILACSLAYTELLLLQGLEAIALFDGPENDSVTKTVKSWGYTYNQIPPVNLHEYDVVIVDRSAPDQINANLDQSKVVKIFDHHFGSESFWQERLGDNAIIKPVGSCATLVWQEFLKLNLQAKISQTGARLLYTAILSNTLNSKASVTTDTDIEARNQLRQNANLPTDWDKIYFNEMSQATLANPKGAMLNDTKKQLIEGIEFTIVQIENWDSKVFIHENEQVINEVLQSFNSDYVFFMSPSISESKTYFIAGSAKTKELLKNILGAQFIGRVGSVKKLLQRSEIIRILKAPTSQQQQ